MVFFTLVFNLVSSQSLFRPLPSLFPWDQSPGFTGHRRQQGRKLQSAGTPVLSQTEPSGLHVVWVGAATLD